MMNERNMLFLYLKGSSLFCILASFICNCKQMRWKVLEPVYFLEVACTVRSTLEHTLSKSHLESITCALLQVGSIQIGTGRLL